MEWKGIFLDLSFWNWIFLNTIIVDDESDKHVLNTLCNNLYLISLQLNFNFIELN